MTRLSHPPTVPYLADERDMLAGFLNAMRLVIRHKLDGLSDQQARATPSAYH